MQKYDLPQSNLITEHAAKTNKRGNRSHRLRRVTKSVRYRNTMNATAAICDGVLADCVFSLISSRS
jgi:hypothetical protein